MLRRLVSRVYWACSRWRLVSEPAPDRPTVLIGAPHTSNWDFVLMLGIAWRLGIDVRWLGKKSLFAGWRGPIMRGLGGIPVDRADPGRVVGEVVERVRRGEVFGLVVTPDGTRGTNEYWKSGFYRIARETGMPVTLGSPFPKGALTSPDTVRLLTHEGRELPAQATEVTTVGRRHGAMRCLS